MAEVLKCYCGACTLTITGDPAVQVAVQSVQQILAHSVHAFVCLCVYVDMCLYVVEPSGFRVLGFFRCLRRLLSINETSPHATGC
jgi:hypothetical protein